MLIAIACVPLAIWIYLIFAHRGFWRVSKHFAPASAHGENRSSAPPDTVMAVIPARNEAVGIGRAVTSLRQQDYPALLRIIVVDDNSDDGTSDLARTAGAAVVQGRPLPSGWTGKMWAVAQGVHEAQRLQPDYLLLTDADVEHSPHNLSQLVQIAETGSYDLVSYMVKLNCETLAEKALIPPFVFFFFLLYPPAAIRSPRSKVAGAAGGCMLIRTAALDIAGGIEQIRSEVIDDCALAKAVKASGGRVWLGLTPSTRSFRKYRTFADIERMISRTAFNQLRHSWLLLFATTLGLAITYLVPVGLVFSGRMAPAIIGSAAWLLISIAYAPAVRFYGRSILWSATLPFAAAFYMTATIHSGMQYATGRGGQWKGRSQDVKVTS